MNNDIAFRGSKGGSLGLFFLFLIAGMLVFLVSITFTSIIPYPVALLFRIAIIALFLTLTIFLRRHFNLRKYWQTAFAFFVASCALFISWLLSSMPLDWMNLELDSPQGIATAKLSESVLIVLVILISNRIAGGNLAAIYLKRGRMALGLTIGLVSLVMLATLAVLQTAGEGIELATIFPWTPWILIFILANGFMEELLFRGLFLRKFQAFFSPKAANLLAAIIFTLVHIKVTYTPDLLIFLVVLFFLAYTWGYVIQKTDSLWGSALFHAGADTLIILGIFASYGV